jgi:single-stranded DNA-specific DHH superfamily exonuclease
MDWLLDRVFHQVYIRQVFLELMLTKKQMQEIREHLDRANSPVFFYDNDADGLCSFLLFRRYLGRGKGVAVRSYPGLAGYAKKAQELNADYVFVLDRPELGSEFVEEIRSFGLPIIWIDHHNIKREHEGVEKYDSAENGKGEPVTYLAYKITNRKEDMWLAIIGCVADHYMPSFAEEFGEKYPELWGTVKMPFDVYYKTGIGRIARILGNGLKDSISNVVKMQNILIEAKGPFDVISEVPKNESFLKKHQEVRKKLDLLLDKARSERSKNLIFFEYSGETSISADIANELSYEFPNIVIVIGFKRGSVTNFSLRGYNVRGILEKVSKELDVKGGGHRDAVGARVKTADLNKFRQELDREVNG